MLRVRLPSSSWDREKLEEIYNFLQGTPELGFPRRDALRDTIRENSIRGSLWAAYLDDHLVGVSRFGSRRAYTHLARHGDFGVAVEYRRRRIGTALYTAQVLQSLLEGRREVEDTIIPSYSPEMVGPTECGGDGVGFLPSLRYQMYGVLPQRTGAFRDVQLWGKPTKDLADFVRRLPPDLSIEIVDTPKAQETFRKNYEVYSRHAPGFAEIHLSLRKAIEDGRFSWVDFRSEGHIITKEGRDDSTTDGTAASSES